MGFFENKVRLTLRFYSFFTASKELQETLPNQIRKETAKPTLRWIFQLLDGIELVKMCIEKTLHVVISGLTSLRKRILGYFGNSVRKIYGLDLQPALMT